MRVIYKYGILLFIMFCSSAPGFAQQLEERLIVKDPGDSLMLKAFRTCFDSAGNYYFETLLKGRGDKFAMITNKKKHSPVFVGSGISIVPYKGLISDAFFSDTTHKKIYYKNKNGTKIYGPYAGKIREVLEFGRDNVAMELCVGAKSYLYINDSMVNVTDSLKQRWLCAFSDNGHVLYSTFKNGLYKLYLDYRLIDSSNEAFSDVAVNNSGLYLYVKADAGQFLVRTSQKSFGPFRAVEYTDLWNSNAWYARGCADSQCYVLVNGKLFNNIPESHNLLEDPGSGGTVYRSDEQMTIEPFGPDNFIFTYNQQDDPGTFLNVNGKILHFNYELTSFVFSDRKGGYAFYGTRRDTLDLDRTYKNINGAEKKLPFFRMGGGRAQCMQLAPNGESLYYFETKDSIYLYRDDSLLCKPTSRKKFLLWDASVFPQSHPEGLDYFQGINIDGATYLVYNNSISKPLPLIYPDYNRMETKRKGAVVAGDFSSKGFFMIENIGQGKYLIVINNKVYKELEGIDNIFGEQCYFDDHQVVFYGLKGTSFYEFKVKY